MSLSRTATLFAAACLFGAAAAHAGDAPPAQPSNGGMMMGGHGGMGGGALRGMFSPEERMMMFADGMKATANLTDDQKRDYRQQQRQRLMAMSDADCATYKADLDKRWAALTPQQQTEIKDKIKAFMAARMGAMHGGSAGGQ